MNSGHRRLAQSLVDTDTVARMTNSTSMYQSLHHTRTKRRELVLLGSTKGTMAVRQVRNKARATRSHLGIDEIHEDLERAYVQGRGDRNARRRERRMESTQPSGTELSLDPLAQRSMRRGRFLAREGAGLSVPNS